MPTQQQMECPGKWLYIDGYCYVDRRTGQEATMDTPDRDCEPVTVEQEGGPCPMCGNPCRTPVPGEIRALMSGAREGTYGEVVTSEELAKDREQFGAKSNTELFKKVSYAGYIMANQLDQLEAKARQRPDGMAWLGDQLDGWPGGQPGPQNARWPTTPDVVPRRRIKAGPRAGTEPTRRPLEADRPLSTAGPAN